MDWELLWQIAGILAFGGISLYAFRVRLRVMYQQDEIIGLKRECLEWRERYHRDLVREVELREREIKGTTGIFAKQIEVGEAGPDLASLEKYRGQPGIPE